MIFLMLACTSYSVIALPPGDSDYVVAESAVISTIKGDSFDLTNTASHVVVSILKAALPDYVTTVRLDSKVYSRDDVLSINMIEQVKADGYFGKQVCSFFLYDQNDEIITLKSPITIKVGCSEYADCALAVNKDGTILDVFPVSINNGYATFDTTILSNFILAERNNPDSTEKAQKSNWIMTFGVACMAGGWLIFTLTSTSKKREK